MRILPVLLALGLAIPAAPAAATPAVGFAGTMHIDCFGCGVSPGTATVTVVGADGATVVTGSASATFSVSMGVGAVCEIIWTASGSLAGAVNTSFTWTVLGDVVVWTTPTGSGIGGFQITSPAVGRPCGGPVTAAIWAVIP